MSDDAEALRRRVAELETELAQTRAIVDRVADAFVSLNDLWQYLYVSPKAGEIFGRAPAELLGKHLWAEQPEGLGPETRHACYKALADQVPLLVEEYSQRWNRWFENRIYPSKNGLTIFFADVTERRKSEENRARLGAVMDATADLVAFADPTGTLLHLNPGGRRMLAVADGAPAPQTLLRMLPERLARRYSAEWLPAAVAAGSWIGDADLQTIDGREVPVALSLYVHKKPEGSLDFLSVLARDVSHRKRHQAELQESELRYRTIVENAPEAIVVLDLQTRHFVDFNENAVKLFGYSREELSMLGPVELSAERQADGRTSAEMAGERIEEAVRGGRPVFEWIHRNARGVEFPCEIRLVRVPAGDRILIRGSIIDISERKRGEELIRESETRFRQIAETIHDVFWIGSPDLSEILYVSPAFEEIWGRPRKELYRSAATWNEAIHPDDGGPGLRVPPTTGPMDNTYRIVRPDGAIRWIRERGFPVFDPGGRPARVVGIAEDVTELHEAEAELLESRRKLEDALRNTQDRVVELEEQIRGRSRYGLIVGKSAEMQEVYRRLRLAGQSPVNILLTGESGTGKEMSARTIHEQGTRKNRPFIAVNCSAIPESLLESELFGHVKGAFTGAVRDKTGLMVSAEGGTLFLDEVGDMPAALQVKMLRAIQEREIRRVGDERPIKVDVQLITATNRNLRELMLAGQMREDFYYRIRVFEIRLPALRERKDDVPLLVSHFMEEFSQSRGKKIRGISAEAMRFLMNYPWPGNVRELRNAMEHAFVTVSGDYIRTEDFPQEMRTSPAAAPRRSPDDPVPDRAPKPAPDPERKRIEDALRKSNGHRGEAARLLGCSRVTLWKNMRKLGL